MALVMIQSFADKLTAAIFAGLEVRKLPKTIQATARRKLKRIDSAAELESLRVPPGKRLEPLRGERGGQWSIRINDQWRICFKWDGGHAYDLEIVDYHWRGQKMSIGRKALAAWTSAPWPPARNSLRCTLAMC
jgi:proteic killer suppression protein